MNLPANQPTQPFVGREPELGQLRVYLSTVVSSHFPKVVLIQGDVGVGKTALIDHFLAEISTEDSPYLIGRGKCSLENEAEGLIPFSEILAGLSAQGGHKGAVPQNVRDFVIAVAPAWLDLVTGGIAGAVVKTVEEVRKQFKPHSFSQESVFAQFTNAITLLSEKQPVVIFIDDLHWADESSLRLLFHLANHLENRAVLLIGTYRPVEAMETGQHATLFRDIRANLIRLGAQEIELREGLDVARYIAGRYPVNNFSPGLAARIQRQTGGHALFVNQLFTWWEETGKIAPRATPAGKTLWVQAQETETALPIPQEVGEVLEERIRQMGDQLRKILMRASVEGEDFTVQTIRGLLELDEVQIYDDINALERNYRMIKEQGTETMGPAVLDFYRFVHRFFREHVYNQLPPGLRRALHRQVGEYMEQLFSDPSPVSRQLARHFRETGNEWLKTAQYALMAAQLEQSRNAWAEGEQWCEIALTALQKLPAEDETRRLRLKVINQSGSGLLQAARYAEAEQRYRSALELTQQMNSEPAQIAETCLHLADICEFETRYDDVMAFIEQGRRVLAEHQVPFGETQAALDALFGLMRCRFGNSQEGVQIISQVLLDTDKLPPSPSLTHLRAQLHNYLAIAYSSYTDSLAAWQKAIELGSSVGADTLVSTALLNIADAYYSMGELDQSVDYAARGLEIARRIGSLDNIAYAYGIRGCVLLELRKPHEALNDLTRAIGLSEKIGAGWNIPGMVADLAVTYLALSDIETAYQKAGEAVAHAERESDVNYYQLGYALDALGQVEVARQALESAHQHFERAIELHQQDGDGASVAKVQCHYAETLLAEGQRQEAIDLYKKALTSFEEQGLMRRAERMRSTLQHI
jgi:predicted ATPase